MKRRLIDLIERGQVKKLEDAVATMVESIRQDGAITIVHDALDGYASADTAAAELVHLRDLDLEVRVLDHEPLSCVATAVMKLPTGETLASFEDDILEWIDHAYSRDGYKRFYIIV